MSERDAMRSRRRELKELYGAAHERLSSILFSEDPAGINFEINDAEYEPEVGTILPRLASCGTVAAVQQALHEEFVRWFGASTAGPTERYATIAARVWTEVVPMLPPR
jgi:hypothetical protein